MLKSINKFNLQPRLLALGVMAFSLIGPIAEAQEPDQGEALAAQCQSCHTLDKDAGNLIGPNLFGVFGATAGSVPDFSYSAAMKASKIIWSDSTLDRFLTAPAKFVPGTKMGFEGIPDPAQRAVLIAYLKRITAKP